SLFPSLSLSLFLSLFPSPSVVHSALPSVLLLCILLLQQQQLHTASARALYSGGRRGLNIGMRFSTHTHTHTHHTTHTHTHTHNTHTHTPPPAPAAMCPHNN